MSDTFQKFILSWYQPISWMTKATRVASETDLWSSLKEVWLWQPRAKKTVTLYLMYARICWEEVNMAINTTSELWHKRLCYMSEKGMWRLADDNLILEVKNVQLEKCIDWFAEKQNRTSFWIRPLTRKRMPMELVHTDVCYVDTKSHASSQNFVIFIDDYSRKFWASVLKVKDQVLSIFKDFQARAERETDRKLKAIRANNGGECIGQFEEYC